MAESKSMRVAYGEALRDIGGLNEKVVVCDADLAHATMTNIFAEKYPERFFNFGIAEANMTCAAAGMAHSGLIPFISTFALFGTGRAYEQIRNSIAYVNANVKVACSHSGLCVGEDGGSHQTVEDIALMRVVPNMTILVPCDPIETRKAVKAAIDIKGPVYIRVARPVSDVYTEEDTPFIPGKANVMKDGSDVAIFATGLMIPEALKAADALEAKGISTAVVNFHTIKPFDTETALAYANKCKAVVTAEELVIMSPTTDFSEDEANKVITYLENGGKLLMFTSYTGTDMPNLDSILENYGVKRSSGIVVETDSQHYYPQMPYYLLPNIQSDDITTEVKSNYILMPVAQAIQKLDSYRDTITIKSLLTTTEDAYIENDPENSTWSKSADSETGAFDLGVSITETVDDKETQIIYFSSASMLSSQIDQAISGANSKLAATALTSMCDVEQTVVIPSKSTSYTNLVFTQGAVNTWSIITIAGIPLVLVVIGVMIWMKRRKQ